MPNALLTPAAAAIAPLALTIEEAAAACRLSTRTLRNRERDGTGPQVKRVGGRVLYPVAALNAWLAGDAGTEGANDAR